MPESVTDRPTKAHEYLFLLSKSRSYFWDADAIREPHVRTWDESNGGSLAATDWNADAQACNGGRQNGKGTPSLPNPAGRNKRSVWTVATAPFPGSHFAVFPPKLVEPCVLAGSSPQACTECGAPWERANGERVLDLSRPQARRAQELATAAELTDDHIAAIHSCGVSDAGKAQVTQDGYGKNDAGVQALADEAKAALGGYYREFLLARPGRGDWQPSCDHSDGSARCTVLDPFSGAGTTGVVALRHDRDFIGIELNPSYAQMARDRIYDDGPLLNTMLGEDASMNASGGDQPGDQVNVPKHA